jgi:hypothetical protein
VYKIETIGDAYMACGGAPEPDRHHPLRVTVMALQVRESR